MDKPWILGLDGSRRAVIKHLLLWLIFYLGFSLLMSGSGNFRVGALYSTFTVFAYMLAYYPLRYLWIPRYYQKHKKGRFISILLLHVFAVYTSYWAARILIMEPGTFYAEDGPFQHLGEFLIRSLRFFSPTILLLVWEYQHRGIRHRAHIRMLEKEKLSTELKFLKAQINPHFLFNSLNNLYSFVITESPRAVDLVTRLTEILDYVLKKSQQHTVPLSAELETIENYIEIEKIRYGDRLTVNLNASGVDRQHVSPLIILSIIENAFKHGASGDVDSPKIDIEIGADPSRISCRVWNTKSKYKGEINDDYKEGIGLSNIKRQLLLLYPEKHNLLITDEDSSFEVLLRINIAA